MKFKEGDIICHIITRSKHKVLFVGESYYQISRGNQYSKTLNVYGKEFIEREFRPDEKFYLDI